MKKILWTVALCLALIPAKAQQTPDARKILDETASLFTSKGGVKATFKADNFTEGNVQGSATGTMCIQGNKFQMTTPDMITWYNGETQWSYMKANDSGRTAKHESLHVRQLVQRRISLSTQGNDPARKKLL